MSALSKYKYKKQYKLLILGCYLFYMAEMTLKLIYSSTLVEIIEEFQVKKDVAVIGMTLYYFVYAAAQLVFAKFIDRMNLGRFMLLTSVLSAVSFASIGLTTAIWQIWIIMGLNGVFQVTCWGAVSFYIGSLLPNDTISGAFKLISTGFAVSTALSLALSSLFVGLGVWRLSFVVGAAFLLASTVFLVIQAKKVRACLRRGDEVAPTYASLSVKANFAIPKEMKFRAGLLLTYCTVAGFFNQALVYGISNWIPNMLSEVHGFPNSKSILLTIITTLSVLPCTFLMYSFFDKHRGRVFAAGAVNSVAVVAVIVALALFFDVNMLLALLLCVLFRFFHGCQTASITGYVTPKMKYHINTGTSSLVTNSLGAAAAGIMPLITGGLIEGLSWQDYYFFMAGLAALLALMTFGAFHIIGRNKELNSWF